MVRDEHNQQQLTKIRTLKLGDAPIKILEAEQRRKGFVAIDDTGRVGVFNTTAEKKLPLINRYYRVSPYWQH